jgi:predicted DNA-binding transcriptional regulator AlpA
MNDANQTPRFTNLIEVARQTSLGKSTILAWEAQGKFPKAVRLSPTKRVWLQSDISNWMLEKCKRT